MKVMHFTEAESKAFAGPAKDVVGRVLIGKADGADNFCMRLFELAPGGYTPRHTHSWEHQQFVHEGTGSLLLNGRSYDLKPGTVAFVPADVEHQIRNTGQEPLVILCLVPNFAPEL